MNIMKTNMLLLDNKMAKDYEVNAAESAAVPSKVSPKYGMNALMFQGMQNLMANPMLAKGVGVMNDDAEVGKDESAKSYVAPFSSNIAFQSKTKTAAMATMTALAALGLVSCEKTKVEVPNVNVEQNVKVEVDVTSITSLLANMQAMLAELMKQAANNDEALLKQLQAIQAELASFKAQQSADNAALKLLLADIGDKVFNLNVDVKAGFNENNAYQQIIIGLLQQHMTKADAIAFFNNLYAEIQANRLSVADAMAQIMEKLDIINASIQENTKAIIDASAQASKERAALIKVAKEIRNSQYITVQQLQMMIAQNNALIGQNNIIINNQNIIAKKIDESTLSVNATIQECAEYLGMKVDDLAEVIIRTGKSLADVMKMSKAQIVDALYKNNAELVRIDNKLTKINGTLNDIDLNVQENTEVVKQSADEILNVLNEINAKLDELSAQFADAVKMFRVKLNVLTGIAADISRTGHVTNSMLANLNKQLFDLRGDVKAIKMYAQSINEQLENGIAVDMDQLEEFFKILNMHQTESKNEIIAKLDEFIDGQDRIENAINNLDSNNQSGFAHLAALLKNITPDNQGVINAINNLSKATENNIAAATETLAAELKALNKKADAELDALTTIINNQVQYGDAILEKLGLSQDILDAIKANGKKLDIANMSLDELKAEVEKIKPELVKLNSAATTANQYLDVIAKKQVEIDNHIENLENIGGGGITKEELEELWTAHDAAAYAKLTAYLDDIHAESMDKADEAIEYLKKGNQKAADIYNLLLDYANKADLNAEQLRDLLQAVYDYLPNLICNCKCASDCQHNQQVDEGIIQIIS